MVYNRSMREIKIAPDEYYHIFNRGMSKQKIFLDKRDWVRFLFLILHFQSPVTFINIGRLVKQFVKHSVFNIDKERVLEIAQNRFVELIAFCLMPNHFHLIIKEKGEGGIARYMQRVLNSYTKYFNTKYKRSGHLFQGPYKAVHVEKNFQLLHLSAYIHKNPTELPEWKDKEKNFPWSSYQDYNIKNRWGELIVPNIITEQFDTKNSYQKFLETSTAKNVNVKHSVFNI